MIGHLPGIDPSMAPRRSFAVSFDYRCPFARNAHEHVLDALEGGADWDVRFVPFSLAAAKDPRWERSADTGLLALEAAIAVRDTQPERFLAAHRALFAHRHDHGGNLRDLDTLVAVLGEAGVDAGALLEELQSGVPLKTVRAEHEAAARDHEVWGVPTFIVGDQAAFVRLMDRPAQAEVPAAEAVERIVDLLAGWPALNEFKHTSVDR
jgi:protein-disulfide isomerase